jgi:Rrf2 family protein
VEYALLAVQYLASRPSQWVTAKEIADEYDISFDLLAKILQQLGREGVIFSMQGTRGGYMFARQPEEVSVAHVIEAIEGEQHIVQCCGEAQHEVSCDIDGKCTIKDPLLKIQQTIRSAFHSMTIAQMI